MKNYIICTTCEDATIFYDCLFDSICNDIIIFPSGRDIPLQSCSRWENVYTMVTHFSGWVEDTEELMENLGIEVNANRSAFYRCFDFENPNKSVVNVISFLTGVKWETAELRGFCQGDWCKVAYNPEKIARKDLMHLECLMFGDCEELGIIESSEKTASDISFDDVDYWNYMTSWESKEEVCEKLGFDINNTIFLNPIAHKTVTYTFDEI